MNTQPFKKNHSTIKQTQTSLAKWFSVRLRIKWLWVRIPFLSLKIILLYTHSTWLLFSFYRFAPVQPEIFADNIILYYTWTTWFSLDLYNLISRFYTYASWNLCKDITVNYTRTTWPLLHLYNLISHFHTNTTGNLCRRYQCTPRSHNPNFTTFVQLDFRVLHLHNLIKWCILRYTRTPWFSL